MNEELKIRIKYLLEYSLSDDICEECVEKIANSIIELLRQGKKEG